MTMPAYTHDTIPPDTSRSARRANAGTVRLSQRDSDGPLTRTIRIMSGLLSPLRYAQVIYLTAPATRPVVSRAAASLPPGDQARMVIRELPAAAFTPEAAP